MSQPLRRSGVRQWSTGVWFPIALASGERSIQGGVSSSRLKTNASFLFGFRLIFKGNVTFLGFLFHLFIWFGRIWSMLDKQMPFTLRVSTGNRLFGQGLFNGSFPQMHGSWKKNPLIYFSTHPDFLSVQQYTYLPTLGVEEMKKCLRMRWGVSTICSRTFQFFFNPSAEGTAFWCFLGSVTTPLTIHLQHAAYPFWYFLDRTCMMYKWEHNL